MWNFIIAVHFVVCIFIIIIILLQSGKGSDMGAAFGGSSQTVFGATGGATFLSKLTTWVAVGFLCTSLLLAYQSTKRTKSTLLKESQKTEQKAAPLTTDTKKEVAVPAASTPAPAATGAKEPVSPSNQTTKEAEKKP